LPCFVTPLALPLGLPFSRHFLRHGVLYLHEALPFPLPQASVPGLFFFAPAQAKHTQFCLFALPLWWGGAPSWSPSMSLWESSEDFPLNFEMIHYRGLRVGPIFGFPNGLFRLHQIVPTYWTTFFL